MNNIGTATASSQFHGKLEKTLSEHTDKVNCVTAINSSRIASASKDQTIKIWDLDEGKLVITLSGHSDPVESIIILNDGRMASSSRDHTIKLWDLNNLCCIATLSMSEGYPIYTVIQLSTGNLLSGTWQAFTEWDIKTNQELNKTYCHMNYVLRILELRDLRVVTCSWNEPYMKIAKRGIDGKFTHDTELNGQHKNSINDFIQLKDGCLASCDEDSLILVWDLDNYSVLYKLEGHSEAVFRMIQLHDSRLLSASSKGAVIVWELSQRKQSQGLEEGKGHSLPINSVIQLNDGRLVTVSDDKSIKLWK